VSKRWSRSSEVSITSYGRFNMNKRFSGLLVVTLLLISLLSLGTTQSSAGAIPTEEDIRAILPLLRPDRQIRPPGDGFGNPSRA